MLNRPSWDQTFLDLATVIACRSKDPSSQVGAVVSLVAGTRFYSVDDAQILCNGEILDENVRAKFLKIDISTCAGGDVDVPYRVFELI